MHIWQWWCELDAGRGGNGFTVNPIGYQDIAAWNALTGRRIFPDEVRLVVAVDAAYRRWIAQRRR